jgi:hypothetical protein
MLPAYVLHESDHPTMSFVGAFPVLLFAFTNSFFFNTNFPTILSGTAMLFGKAVVLEKLDVA